MKKFIQSIRFAAEVTLLIIVCGAVFILPWAMVFNLINLNWLAFAACVGGEVLAIAALNYILESK